MAGRPAPSLEDLVTKARALVNGQRPPVWLIVQEPSPPLPAPSGSRPVGERFVTGIILAATYDTLTHDFPGLVPAAADKWNASYVELVVWLRRGYRSTLLGSPSVREVLENELPAVLGVAKNALPTLWTRYPKPGEDGESNHEWGLWLNFLARFDFRRCHAKEPHSWKCTLLKRKKK